MKNKYIPLLLIILLGSCSKTDVTAPATQAPVVTTTTPTTPTTNTLNVWQLTAISINNVPLTLTPLQAAFKMTLSNDGRYSDSDGVVGNWVSPTTDSLKINQTNLPTPIALKYKIITRTTTSLSLSQNSTDRTISLIYEAK